MKTGWHRGLVSGLALGALWVAGTATPVAAQERDDCRCVDRDGNAIENCTCFVMPRMPDFMAMATPNASRPRLGVSVSVDQDEAMDARGARVTDVMDEGPADEAGIREGDIITGIDGRSLLEPLDADTEDDFDSDESLPVQRLLAIARELESGERVRVDYLRDGTSRSALVETEDVVYGLTLSREALQRQLSDVHELTAELRSRGNELQLGRSWSTGWQPPQLAGWNLGRTPGGLEIIELTPGLADFFGVERGVLVAGVDDDSASGLQAGDVLLAIGDRDATTPARVRRILSSYADDEDVTFHVRRDGRDIEVRGRLDD